MKKKNFVSMWVFVFQKANFETFCWVISSSINLWFLKNEYILYLCRCKYLIIHRLIYYIFRYDPHATQFINFSQLSDFIASLDTPLGIPKPNILALVSFDLPIARGDKIHCLDVLHSLTKYTLGFVDDGDEDFGKVNFFSLISHLF